MSGWLRATLLAVALMVGTWALLVLAARRLPPGLLRDLASFMPHCVTTIRRLRGDPRVPRRSKIVVVAIALRYAARQVPREVLAAAWPGEPRLLERLLGSPDPTTG